MVKSRTRWIPLLAATCVTFGAGCDSAAENSGRELASEVPEASESELGELEVEGPYGRLVLSGWVDHHVRDSGRLHASLFLRAVEVDEWGNLLLEVEGVTPGAGGNYAAGGIRLVDDLGSEYDWVPPDENPGMSVSGEQRMLGRLVFRGPVDEEARSFDVQFNDNAGSHWSNMRFQFENVPLPGVGLEGAAVGAAEVLDHGLWEVGLSAESQDDARVSVEVHSVEVRGGSTILRVTARNSRVSSALLLPWLDDGVGTRFGFQRGDHTQEGVGLNGLSLEGESEADATLVWRGVPSSEATALTLIFNRVSSELRPYFQFEIPIPEE